MNNGPSKLKIFSWVISAPFFSDFYKLGMKTYIRNKFMKFISRERHQSESRNDRFSKNGKS